MSDEVVEISCLPIVQPIGQFYVGVIDSDDLISISWTDVRQFSEGDELEMITEEEGIRPIFSDGIDDEFDNEDWIDQLDFKKYMGIQRKLSMTRVREISEYVNNIDATFPTGILISIPSKYAHYDEDKGVMSVVKHSKAAKIIDGQHRIAGLKGYKGSKYQLNVSIFIDMNIQDQAMVFATINLKQTKVNKSLAYDLYEFTKSPSPQKTSHDIAKFMNYKEGSPLKDKIKMLGSARARTETITQATFIDRLLRFITDNPMQDRDQIKRKHKRTALARSSSDRSKNLVFRDLFIDDKDAYIARILWNFFTAVSERWPIAWRYPQKGNILNRTTGFSALMRFLCEVYKRQKSLGDVLSVKQFQEFLNKVPLTDEDFSPEKYLPGSSGEKILLKHLVDNAFREPGLFS